MNKWGNDHDGTMRHYFVLSNRDDAPYCVGIVCVLPAFSIASCVYFQSVELSFENLLIKLRLFSIRRKNINREKRNSKSGEKKINFEQDFHTGNSSLFAMSL